MSEGDKDTNSKYPEKYAFRIFVCGSKGGSYAADITSFFLAEHSDPYNFISMDAGTSLDCIKVAAQQKQMDQNAKLLNFDEYNNYQKHQKKLKDEGERAQTLTKVGYFRKKQLNAFLITHAHVDHTAGLLVSSAEDDFTQKPVLGLNEVMDGLKTQFQMPLWPGNFWYQIINLEPKEFIKMQDTDKNANRKKPSEHFVNSQIKIKPYRLSHGNEMSSVFLICNNEAETSCIVFFGDTGPDVVEKMVAVKTWINFGSKLALDKEEKEALEQITTVNELKRSKAFKDKFTRKQWAKIREIQKKHMKTFGAQPLRDVWNDVRDKIKGNILNTIFIESSYISSRPNGLLFGHLTPKYIVNQLEYIEKSLGEDKASVSVVVTHIKPTWNTVDGAGDKNDFDSTEDTIRIIVKELNEKWNKGKKGNLEVRFIIPKQGDMIYVMDGDKAEHVQSQFFQQEDYDSYVYHDMKYIRGVSEHSGRSVLSELAIGYVGVLIFVVVFCFVIGLVFGVGVACIKERRTRRAKEDN